MRRYLRYAVLGGGLVVVCLAGLAAARFHARLLEPYRNYSGPERLVEIAPGAGALAIARELIDAGVVRDQWAFRYAVWQTDNGRRLQAGEYRFDQPMTALDVVDKLARGEVHLRPITFPEGLTLADMAAIFGQSDFGTAEAFLEAAGRVAHIAHLDSTATDLEGYLFPETYALPRTATADDLVRAMVARFEQTFDERLRRASESAGLTLREAVTLASLVELETAQPDERPIVSAVYNNRLEIGMALQCDPTVIYALEQAGEFDGNLTRENLQVDSPYNTYLYPGLPPGPIASPGRSAIEAALHPADVRYLYFVSRNDGSHVFANSLREHNRNVREYQVRFFRERRRRQQEEAATLPPIGRPGQGPVQNGTPIPGRVLSSGFQRSAHFNFSLRTVK